MRVGENHRSRSLVAIVAIAISMAAALLLPAAAQIAGRTITIIVPYSPGTGIDILARALGNELAGRWSQPVVVDNKTGASGNIGTQLAARSWRHARRPTARPC
jgi:tripartite-type tricarboxylate transporter receptor subunit TctC